MNSGCCWRCFCLNYPGAAMAVDGLGGASARCWAGCYEFYAAVRAGRTCPSAFRPTRFAIGAFRRGCVQGRCVTSLKCWLRTCANAARSTSPNATSMARSSWRKRGGSRGPHQAGQGHEAHGAGRRFCLPVAAHTTSASPAEVTLVEATLETRFVAQQPERLIGDKAYDSDPLNEQLAAQDVQMIAPHRRGRKKLKTQDGRVLRRYRRRWMVERLNAWLQNFRRILTRHEYHAENYLGFVYLGCIKILLRQYL